VFLPVYLGKGTRPLPTRTTFSFFMNQEAPVQIVFKRVLAGGRLGGRGQIFRLGVIGKNRVPFEGVTSSPDPTALRLTPGRYKAFFHSRNEFGSSPAAAIGFRIAKPRR